MAKKAIKKRWAKLYASKAFNEVELAETYVADPRECIGRRVPVSLSVLGVDTRQNINLTFEVTEIHGDRLMCEPIAYRIMPSSVKRMMRRQREKIEDSFLVLTKDGVKLRVKPILVTRFRTTSSAKRALREHARNQIATVTQKTKYIDLIKDLVAHRVQKQLFERLKKIFPLSVCEIRWLIRVGDGEDVPELEEEAQSEPEKSQDNEEKPASEEEQEETQSEAEDEPPAEEESVPAETEEEPVTVTA